MQPQRTNSDNDIRKLAAERCELVRGWLQEGDLRIDQSTETLTQVIELLNSDSTPEAEKIIELAGDLWRTLAIKIADIRQMQETLLQGVHLFAGKPPTQQFEEMLYQVEQVFTVQYAVEVAPDKRWPSWLEQSDAPQRLTRVVKAFDVLGESENWPYLQNQIDRCYQRFINEILPAYLAYLYELARQYSRERKFALSTQTVERAIKLLRHEIRSYLQLSFTEDDLHQLKDTLAIREQAEVTLWSAAVRLTDTETLFSEVVPNISVLILNHPDVPVQDLNALLADLYQAEKSETLYLKLTNLDHFTENINAVLSMGAIDFEIADQPPEFLIQADPKLAIDLQSRFNLLSDSLIHAADDIANTLAERIHEMLSTDAYITDPNLLLRYYWQANWCSLSGIIKDTHVEGSVEDAIYQTETALDKILTRIAENFINLMSAADLDHTLVLLDALCILNQGLVHNSAHNQIKLHHLPPLPAGVIFPPTSSRYENQILEIWSGIMKLWVSFGNEGQYPEIDTSLEIDELQRIKNHVMEIQRDFKVLKNEIWPRLNLREWTGNTALANLGSTILRILQMMTILNDLDKNLGFKSPIDRLVYFDEHIIDSGLFEEISAHPPWLLEKPIIPILKKLNDRYQKIRKGVETYISELLTDKTEAIETFREEVLNKPQSPTTSNFIFDVILSTTDLLVSVNIQSGDIADAISLWDSIRIATAPWKQLSDVRQTVNPAVDEKWHELHKRTTKEKNKLSITRKKGEIIIAAAIICVVLVIWIGITTLSPKNQRTIDEGAAGLTTTITPDLGQPFQQTHQAELMRSESALRLSIQETGTAEITIKQTATAHLLEQLTATSETTDSLSELNNAEDTASTLTATALDEIHLAKATITLEASLCRDALNYGFVLASETELDPPEGSTYITGTTPIRPSAVWEITNTGLCVWEEITLNPLSGNNKTETTLWMDNQPITNLSDQPLGLNETLKIALNFDISDATDIHEEWILVVNGIELIENPHLSIDVENWITLITPPSSRP
jgi:hypothetical protein